MDGRDLKHYLRFKDEAYTLRLENQHLRCELNACQPQLYQAGLRIDTLEQHNARLLKENRRLTQKLADVTAKLQAQPKSAPPALVKANVPGKGRGKPGRKVGHPAALRPMPGKIDLHVAVNVPMDTLGKACCPECRSQLSEVAGHKRYVEELVPSKVLTTCYHTTSGWCPSCRRTVESRAQDQPPAADVPHAQLGLNALATAAVMRVCYRLPLRKIT